MRTSITLLAGIAILAALPVNAQIEPVSLSSLGIRGPVHLLVVRSSEGIDSLIFDTDGRLIEELRRETGEEAPPPRHVRYDYDSAGRLLRVTTLDRDTAIGSMVECGHDSLGRRISERLFRGSPLRIQRETRFSYADDGWMAETIVVGYDPDGTRRDSARTSFVTDGAGATGWIRSIAALDSGGTEVTYRDQGRVLRRRVIGQESDPVLLDDFDGSGYLIGMYRVGGGGKRIAYYFTNDTLGNPLRRTMGFVGALNDYTSRYLVGVVTTEFIYEYDRVGNWVRREERTAGHADFEADYQGGILGVETREIIYHGK